MDRDRAGVEAKLAALVGLPRELLRQVAVLDHLEHAVGDHEVADLLERVRLRDRLAAHLAARQVVEAEEERVDRVDDRVVDLEVADVLDASASHVGERAAAVERPERPAVAVGRERQLVLLAEQHVALVVERRDHPLFEEEHVLGRVAEMAVPLEEGARLGVVHLARHDVPRDHVPGVAGVGAQLLGEDPEERLVRDRRHRKLALGTVVAEPRPLPSRDEERRDLALTEQLLSATGRACVELAVLVARIARIDRDGLDRRRQREERLRTHVRLRQLRDRLQIERLDLSDEPRAPRVVQLLPEPQHVILPDLFQLPTHIRVAHYLPSSHGAAYHTGSNGSAFIRVRPWLAFPDRSE